MNQVLIIFGLTLILKFKFVSLEHVESWTGSWFPNVPGEPNLITESNDVNNSIKPHESNIPMGEPNDLCDNGEYNLVIDFDANNLTHNQVFLCIENKKLYTPDYKVQPILTKTQIPPAYVAQHSCMNESIDYDERLPTFGTHRPLWPRFGEYLYVPPQRWVHSLEHGAVIALYHPCANEMQVNKLRDIVKRCLWRYIISPSDRLTSDKPMALLAWGTSLEFSVIDDSMLIDFIQQNALKGPEKVYRDGQYNKNLIEEAKIVSTVDDKNLCPNNSSFIENKNINNLF